MIFQPKIKLIYPDDVVEIAQKILAERYHCFDVGKVESALHTAFSDLAENCAAGQIQISQAKRWFALHSTMMG